MGAFNYTALSSDGNETKGSLTADSERIARQQLRAQGLTPLSMNAVNTERKSAAHKKSFTFGKRVRLSDLSLVTRQLATLLTAGLTVEESFQSVSEQTEKKHVQSVILGVRAGILEGHSIATAMRQFPQVFPELYCATVGAGEKTGKLDLVLNRLADYTEQQQLIKQKIQQALIYPSLMIFVSISIVSFLLVFVVPKIINVFQNSGQSLPSVTKLLITVSEITKSYGLFIVIALVATLVIFRYLKSKSPKIQKKWDGLLLRLPMLGYAIKTVNTARYARTFGILSAAGVPVLEAMRVSSTLITNLPMKERIAESSNRVKEGANIHLALKQTKYFNAMTIHLIANGESSGRLEEMLERAAENQENALKRLIDMGLTLFEPLIILAMGGVVLFIVLAILLPIFEINQFIG